ncbi:AAA family ATPase [Pseudalkalibacillus caeni]|uniref:Nuclease SbcCD subunit C n=1 Tax=Exobacillus caeni TaxID=2574798 RepID=A0A5R9F2K0_9BACL|nr:AAA family ATPase [Pseudalkalibacillus caeni]TLS36759.1 SMC family ATPase [Pseudalkalibacillus caeni]
MKPLTLKMTAFGPYKKTETIDFHELKHNRLFVVSGNTGAGKTTIFDAICFALYGSASGEDRNDYKMLRSDFADDDIHTSVEFEFEVHSRIYRILRQLGHVKQGNKTATGEKYEFFEIMADREVPCVDRQIVSEINKKVEEILGLTQDQFSQIVMLPQGEFRKLLTSQTENKEEILRRIFKTEPYKHISDRLKDKKKYAEELFKLESQSRDNYIQNISAALPEREESHLFAILSEEHYNINQVLDGLEKEAAFYTEKILLDREKYDKAFEAHSKKTNEYHEAKALNERFLDFDEKEERLKSLNDQQPVIKEKENTLEKAERAARIEVYENNAKEWREEKKAKTTALAQSKSALKQANEQTEKAEKDFEAEEQRKEQREETAKKLDRLKDLLPIVQEIDKKKKALTDLEEKVKQFETQLKTIEYQVKSTKESKDQLFTQIRASEKSVDKMPEKQQGLSDLREKCKVLQDYLKLKKNREELKKDVQIKEKDYQSIKSQYTETEKAWLSGQAILLAAHLHDGEACPVCGSKEHPEKASTKSGYPTKEQLEAMKKKLEEKEGAYRDALARINAVSSQLDAKAEEVTQYDVALSDANAVFTQLVEQGKQLKQEVEALKKEREDLSKKKESHEKLEKQIEKLETKKAEVESTFNEQKSAYASQKAVYEDNLKTVPEEIRILSELEKKISETERLKTKLEKAWEEAQKRLQFAIQEQTKAVSNVEHAHKQLEETESKKEKTEEQFKKALSEAKFETEEAYQTSKMQEVKRQQLKSQIETFKQNLATLTYQVNELQVALKEKKRVDLSAISEEMERLKQAYETALNALNQSKEYKEEAVELKTHIIEANEKVADLEQQMNRIADLYDMIRGQNSKKISFERYLQIEYLEQIIDAANQRLRRLSNGQFYLIRSERQESRGKQSGLGLDVHDAYTGQTRDVKTLSGGEKFNASLCLALGMADVIQSFQGGVSIETMFIDEGFGSLDEESLNKSIDTLVDLQQSGRMIGVISHVQELKAAIPAILEVKKTKEGYSETRFVIK